MQWLERRLWSICLRLDAGSTISNYVAVGKLLNLRALIWKGECKPTSQNTCDECMSKHLPNISYSYSAKSQWMNSHYVPELRVQNTDEGKALLPHLPRTNFRECRAVHKLLSYIFFPSVISTTHLGGRWIYSHFIDGKTEFKWPTNLEVPLIPNGKSSLPTYLPPNPQGRMNFRFIGLWGLLK